MNINCEHQLIASVCVDPLCRETNLPIRAILLGPEYQKVFINKFPQSLRKFNKNLGRGKYTVYYYKLWKIQCIIC